MRAVWAAILVLCLLGLALAEEPQPTLYYYQARGQNLLAVDPGGEQPPAFLVFPDHCRFLPDFAMQLGESLFPADANHRVKQIRAFQAALKKEYTSATEVTGLFSINTVQQIHRSAEQMKTVNQLGPVRVVHLNQVIQGENGLEALRDFLRITTQVRQGNGLSEEQINRCRPTMERNLNSFVERGAVRIIRGVFRGVFGLAACSQDRTDTDGDGLYDIDEINLYGSDPEKEDTDGDGLSDGREVEEQSRGRMLNPTKMDTDSDGLTDAQEMSLREKGIMVDPNRDDTDGDGLTDRQEIESSYRGRSFDPTNPASFPGGLDDREIYEKYILPRNGWGIRSILMVMAFLLLAGTIGTVLFLRRRGRSSARKEVRAGVIRSIELSASGEESGADVNATSVAKEPPESGGQAVRETARRESAVPAEIDRIQSRVEQLASSLQRVERLALTNGSSAAETPVELHARVQDMEAALAEMKGNSANDCPSPENNPAYERLGQRLEQLEAAVRTIEHVAFADSTGNEKEDLAARLERQEKTLSELKAGAASLSENFAANQQEIQQQLKQIQESVAHTPSTKATTDNRELAELRQRLEELSRLLERGEGPADIKDVQDRISAMGRVLMEVNARLENLETQSGRKVLPEAAARASFSTELSSPTGPAAGPTTQAEVLKKVKDIEQMVVRSMSEWGRLFTDLEDKMIRIERAHKLKK